jgi:hypothetical protein
MQENAINWLAAIGSTLTLLTSTVALADTPVNDPKIGGLPVDHCASVNGPPSQNNDCSANGNQLVSEFICKDYHYSTNVGFASWIGTTGQAVHLQVTEDPSGNVVNYLWPVFPTGGIIDRVICR